MDTHFSILDPYRSGGSLVHHLDARVKFILAVAFILSTSLTPPGAWPVYVLLLALVFSGALLSELGIGFVLKRSLLATPFILAGIPLLFTTPGDVLAQFPFFGALAQITAPGLVRFISILLKSWIAVQAAILLASTTAVPDLLFAMRSLRIPKILVAVIGLMWRYLFVMGDEALRLSRARAARSGASAETGKRMGGSVAWRGKVTGGMVGNLMLRSFDRSDRIYAAMLARGYDGEVRSLPRPALGRHEIAILAGGLAILLVITLLGAFL